MGPLVGAEHPRHPERVGGLGLHPRLPVQSPARVESAAHPTRDFHELGAPAILASMVLSNKELGDLIGVSHSMASRIRNGRRLPGTRTLGAINRGLGVPLSDLHAAHREGPAAFGALLREHLLKRETRDRVAA